MPAEFVCCECGTRVLRYDLDSPPAPPLCLHCMALPGWFNDPRLREIFGRGRTDLPPPDPGGYPLDLSKRA